LVKDPEMDDENDSHLCQDKLFHGNSCATPVNVHYLFASPPTLSSSVERYRSKFKINLSIFII